MDTLMAEQVGNIVKSLSAPIVEARVSISAHFVLYDLRMFLGDYFGHNFGLLFLVHVLFVHDIIYDVTHLVGCFLILSQNHWDSGV